MAAFTAAGRPVAVKAVADGVLHKAAAGGVRLGLTDPEAVARAAAELATGSGERLRGLLVQPMAPAGPELLVGVTGDPVFGPLVTVGLGGTSTDLVADRAHRLVPLTDADAEEMLGEFRAGARLFDPAAGPALDRAGVRDVIVRVGRLAETAPRGGRARPQPGDRRDGTAASWSTPDPGHAGGQAAIPRSAPSPPEWSGAL